MFERAVVINLEDKTERLQQFFEELPSDWPFEMPIRFPATDGRRVPQPQWWQTGASAWGCFRSHYRVLEEALNDGLESILVFEDDAVFRPRFSQQANEFFEALPPDWNWIYLGGQHIEQEWGLPTRVNRHVYRPFNVHRSHAYGIRGRRAMEYVFNHLNTPAAWGWGTHVDHRLGELHKNFPGGVYVPSRWFVGQREGYSSIKRRELPRNFFVDAQSLVDAPITVPMLAVVGADDQTRGLVAAGLHWLGVSMGEHAAGRVPLREQGVRVAPGLAGACSSFFSETDGRPLSEHRYRVSQLRRWASKRGTGQRGKRSLLGGTHPILNLLPESLCEAWDRPTVIRVAGRSRKDKRTMVQGKVHESLSRFDDLRFHALINLDCQTFENGEALCQHLVTTLNLTPDENARSRSLRAFSRCIQAIPAHESITTTD